MIGGGSWQTKAAGTQWDLRVQLLSGKELQAKDTVAEGTYGTGFTHSSDPYVVFKVPPPPEAGLS